MEAEEMVFDRVEARKLRWFVHMMRMPQGKWPAIFHSWVVPGRRQRDDLGRSWRDGNEKEDGGRRRPGSDSLEKRIRKAADSRISPYMYIVGV
jgi:hypothetical protein